MIVQTKNRQLLLENARSLTTSDVFQRGPIYPLRVSARIWGASNNQSATILIKFGQTTTPDIESAEIVLTEDTSEYSYTIYGGYTYVQAEITAFDTSKPGSVTIQIDAIEK